MNKSYKKKDYEKMADLFKVMANAKRLEILDILGHGEMNVSELIKVIGIRKANASQHLMILRYLGIVTTRHEGKKVFYKIRNPGISKIIGLINLK